MLIEIRNVKSIYLIFLNNILYMLYNIEMFYTSYLKSIYFYIFKFYTLFSLQVSQRCAVIKKNTCMKTPVKPWCWIHKKQLQSFHPNCCAAQWKHCSVFTVCFLRDCMCIFASMYAIAHSNTSELTTRTGNLKKAAEILQSPLKYCDSWFGLRTLPQ